MIFICYICYALHFVGYPPNPALRAFQDIPIVKSRYSLRSLRPAKRNYLRAILHQMAIGYAPTKLLAWRRIEILPLKMWGISHDFDENHQKYVDNFTRRESVNIVGDAPHFASNLKYTFFLQK